MHLELEDNQNNGMQAMAVAPVNDREEDDTSNKDNKKQFSVLRKRFKENNRRGSL